MSIPPFVCQSFCIIHFASREIPPLRVPLQSPAGIISHGTKTSHYSTMSQKSHVLLPKSWEQTGSYSAPESVLRMQTPGKRSSHSTCLSEISRVKLSSSKSMAHSVEPLIMLPWLRHWQQDNDRQWFRSFMAITVKYSAFSHQAFLREIKRKWSIGKGNALE